MNPQLLLIACVACISFACADSGTVPEPDPEPTPVPAPVPEAAEPYLEVSPAVLNFDTAGNALNEEAFVVKTNCAWRLDIPDGADWLEASEVSGRGLDTVSFRLYIDRTYHAADLVFTAERADGGSALVQSVTVRQGTEPAESDPTDPTDPSNPGDDPGDPKDDPDQNPTPEEPPATPAAPSIVAVDPTVLWWNADDRGQTKQIAVYVANFEGHTLELALEGADADRFEAHAAVREEMILRVDVGTIGVNESDVDYTASLVLSVEGGNRLSVPLTQVKRRTETDGRFE